MTTRYKSPAYIAWDNMLQRCTNPNNARYADYGARGIQVCERWKSFANFVTDMGAKPDATYTLERKDNNGNYEPNNCHWIPAVAQGRNKRIYATNNSGISGVRFAESQGIWRVKIQGEYRYNGKDFFEACCVRKSWDALIQGLRT